MARDNPTNPFTQDPQHTSKDVQMPISKARVMASKGMPDGNGYHSVRIRVYGDQSTYVAPVVTPMPGSVWVPKEGTDVAVLFDTSDKPWVIGAWYAFDRVEDGDVFMPDYEPGDIRIGNHTESHVTVHDDGHISVVTPDNERVDIDHQSAAVYLSNDYDVPDGNTYYKIPFDTVEADDEQLFQPATNDIKVKADGLHDLTASVEIPSPKQNNLYTIAIFVNGTEEKRVSRQSANNEPMSVQVTTMERLDAGDVVDIRLRQNSNGDRTVLGSDKTTEFDVRRAGI